MSKKTLDYKKLFEESKDERLDEFAHDFNEVIRLSLEEELKSFAHGFDEAIQFGLEAIIEHYDLDTKEVLKVFRSGAAKSKEFLHLLSQIETEE